MPSIEGSLMHRSPRARGAQARSGRRPRFWAAALSAGLAGVALAALAGIAIAKASTLGVAKNVKVKTKSENVVVDSHGIAVYTLSDETTKPHHVKLTCTKASGCFAFWFPVTVHSASTKLTAASGIKGKLGLLRRNGFFQVTLGGKPLYTFKLDENSSGKPVKGKTIGEGIPSFGGVWHVIVAASSSHAPTHTTTTTTTSTNPYSY
jgi:predicted lipoprotein with Yx(FWY)xxD motif